MKRNLLIIILGAVFGTLTYFATTGFKTPITTMSPSYRVEVIAGCEYVVYNEYAAICNCSYSGITHKGNCKYCAEKAKSNIK